MEIARCPDPLYTTPKPCYTADFNHYLTLHRSVLSSEQDYHWKWSPFWFMWRAAVGG